MAEVMSRADLAVGSFGVTAYELAAAGVPAIYLCLTQDHAESATAPVREGVAVSLGTYEVVTVEALAEVASHLLNDNVAREGMSMRASGLVDGRGVERIARAIIDEIGRTT
jgi:spore coat polysaccharide biosynthesis protein SpsF